MTYLCLIVVFARAVLIQSATKSLYPPNCHEPMILKDDVYLVNPDDGDPLLVYCRHNGWLRIMLMPINPIRFDIFYFLTSDISPSDNDDALSTNYWIGLSHLKRFVRSEPTSLRIELTNEQSKVLYFIEYGNIYFTSSHVSDFILKLGKKTAGNITFKYNDFRKYTYEWSEFSNVEMLIMPRYPFKASNCYDIKLRYDRFNDGIYNIYLINDELPIKVYCEMKKGGWTRISNRINLDDSFDKDWTSYAKGFGNIEANYWLGLENINMLTNMQQMSIRIELFDNRTNFMFIEYEHFSVHSERDGFKIEIGPKSRGYLEDILNNHNGMKFFSRDADNENDCAKNVKGAWWYDSNCDNIFLANFDSEIKPPTTYAKIMIRPTRKIL